MKNNEMKCICTGQSMFLRFVICFVTFLRLRNTLEKRPLTCGNVFRYFVRNFALTATDTLPCSLRAIS